MTLRDQVLEWWDAHPEASASEVSAHFEGQASPGTCRVWRGRFRADAAPVAGDVAGTVTQHVAGKKGAAARGKGKGAKGEAPAPNVADMDTVLAWMRANKAGPWRAAQEFKLPREVVQGWHDDKRAAEHGGPPRARSEEEEQALAALDGKPWEELADRAIAIDLAALAAADGDPMARRARTDTVKTLSAARANLISIQQAKAAALKEGSGEERPDFTTPEGKAALLADLVKLPGGILEEALELQRGG